MADTITLTFDTPKAQRIGATGAAGFISGLATLSSYSQSKTALSALLGYFVPSTAFIRVSNGGVSSNGYIIRWDDTAQAFRAYAPGAGAVSLVAPAAASQVTSGVSGTVLSYTAPVVASGGVPGNYIVSGGTAISEVQINRGAYTTPSLGSGAGPYHLDPGDKLTITATSIAGTTVEAMPEATTAVAAAAMAEVANATNVGTFDFVAFGQMPGA